MNRVVATALLTTILTAPAGAQVIFSDNFDAGPSPLWSNQRGEWTTGDGTYFATQPSNNPTTVTLLPFADLGDLDLEMDIRAVSDGGVWLHADADCENTVLLVTGGSGHSGQGFYWHVLHGGNVGPAVGYSAALFQQGDDIHIRVTVRGGVYAVYLNGATDPATTISLPDFPTGRVGLYDFTVAPGQRFDNVVLSNPCAPDFNGDGFVNGDDFDGFVEAFEAGDTSADFDHNGFVNGDDFDAFVEAFEAGC